MHAATTVYEVSGARRQKDLQGCKPHQQWSWRDVTRSDSREHVTGTVDIIIDISGQRSVLPFYFFVNSDPSHSRRHR
jgi:hypothetical protein